MDAPTFSYAGFWKRFVAFVIDSILLSIVESILVLPIMALLGLGIFARAMHEDFEVGIGFLVAMISAYLMIIVISTIAGWLYFALMESSARGATIGKMVLGIRVTDLEGNRISFGRATGRYFGKILSSMILMIGYIMAGFTERKQALHDILASCLVINDRT